MNANLTAALALASEGIYVFPASATWNQAAGKLDKKPLIVGWQQAASIDPKLIEQWWSNFPEAIVGIELGRSNLFVVDLDRHPGGADGIANFKAFRNDNRLLRCPVTKTPSGGYHLFFKQPEGEQLGNRTGALPAGCDVRGQGGWVVGPGSSYRKWKWTGDPKKLSKATELPPWLLEALRTRKSYSADPGRPSHSNKAVGERERRYAERALAHAADRVAAAQRGRRNTELNNAAFGIGTLVGAGWIGRYTTEGRLYDAAVQCGLVADDGEIKVRATLKSGIEAGIAKPHDPLPDPDRGSSSSSGSSIPPQREKPPADQISKLAALDGLEYERQRETAAEEFGIRVSALDREVKTIRAKTAEADAELPHWKVEPWGEPVDGVTLLTDIERIFTRHVYLPTGASVALALWTLHAWTMDAGDISPFIVLVSPTKRCGKTTVLILLYYLTPKSELASNISPSSVFRYVEDVRPTLLIDEADTFVANNEELRGILNSGHTKAAANVIRNVEVNGEHKPRRFSTWAPKAIAAIRELADTLEDRAILLTLQRKSPGAKVERLRKRDNGEFAVLRRKIARWATDNFPKLEADPDPQTPEVLNDRAADNWRPLFQIAELAGGNWPGRAREAACILSGAGHDNSAIQVELLADIQKAFGEVDIITSAALVEALVADLERPWATWGKNAKPLTQNQLARLLRPFGIVSETVHPVGRPHAKGYGRARFTEAWEAYLPGQNTSSPPSSPFKACKRASGDEMGTSSDFQSVREASSHGSKNANLSYSHAGSHVCTDRNTESGREGHSASARVWIRAVWPPEISAGPDDDVFDIDPQPRWRQ